MNQVEIVLEYIPKFLCLDVFVDELQQRFEVLASILPFHQGLLYDSTKFLQDLVLGKYTQCHAGKVFTLCRQLGFQQLLLLQSYQMLLLAHLDVLLHLLCLILLPFLFHGTVGAPLGEKVDKRCENYEIERKGIIGEVERAGYGKMIFHLTDFLSQIIIGFCLECVFSVIQATVADFGLFQVRCQRHALSSLQDIMEMYGQFIVMRQAY